MRKLFSNKWIYYIEKHRVTSSVIKIAFFARGGISIKKFVVHPHNLNVTSVTDGVATFTFGANFDVLMVQGKDFSYLV